MFCYISSDVTAVSCELDGKFETTILGRESGYLISVGPNFCCYGPRVCHFGDDVMICQSDDNVKRCCHSES